MGRRRAPLLVLVTLAAAAACAGGGRPGTPGGPALEYRLPEPATATYTFSDTTRIVIQTGAIGDMEVVSTQTGVAEITFRQELLEGQRDGEGERAQEDRVTGAGLEATVRVLSYAGRFENPAQGGLSADETDIDGGWTVRLDAGGIADVIDTPSFSRAARQVTGAESLVRALFPHLPGRPAAPGATWTDTVTITDEADGTVSRTRRVVTSTLAGDTVVAGERLLLIRTSSVVEIEVEGSAGGVEIQEILNGRTQGEVLWDPERSLLVEQWDHGTLEGVLALPGSGVAGLPVTGTIRRSVAELR